MSEVSFPVVNKPLSEDQWKSIAMGFGQGIIDRGGWPYLLTNRDNVTNEITIGVDQGTGRNEAILGGFVHRIDHAKTLPIPPVANTTTYEVGLVYDPLNHGTEAGPITLDVWTAPGDYSQGKLRLILYRITRSPSQTLTAATVAEWRQRISTQIAVSNESDLPVPETMLVDTIALVRNGNKWYRSHKDINTGVVSWTQVTDNTALDSATWEPIGDTLMKRHSNGSVHAEVGTGGKSLIHKDYLDNLLGGNISGGAVVPATPNATGHSIMRRWDSGVSRVKFDAAHGDNIVNVSGGDARYRRQSVAIDGRDLSKTGNEVWWEIIGGSLPAYQNVQSGSVFTVSVNSTGKFMRFSSRRDHKDQIQPLDLDAALRLLNVEIVKFKRREEPNGKVPEDARWEYGVIIDDEVGRKNGVPELVLSVPEEDGSLRPEGWDEHSHAALLTLLAQHQAREQARLDHNQRVIATKLGLSYDESGYLMGE